MAAPIDFRFVKQQADFLAVLAHYGLQPRGKGVQRSLACPFHPDRTPSCKINLGRKVFHCFGCDAKGNVLDFVRRMENLAEDDLRAAARKLAEIAGSATAPGAKEPAKGRRRPAEAGAAAETTAAPSTPRAPRHAAPAAPRGQAEEAPPNPPLEPGFVERFEAKLERAHPYLDARGLGPELIGQFGLGYCPADGRSMMRGRITIPIHDEHGRLLAYAGRWAGPAGDIPEGQDKYLLPAGFQKSRVLYNLHRARGRRHLVLVEGYFAVFRLHALGVPAAAMMGRTLAPEQLTLLEASGTRYLTVLLDGDDPGREAAPAIMRLLARTQLLAKLAVLPEGVEPDTVDERILRELLGLRP